MRAARHSAIALSGSQINSSSAQGGLLLARSNLRRRGSYARNPTGLTMQVSVSLRPLFGIPAECSGLIAKKSPPRLSRPSASSGHVARHRCLGDAETEHQKFTMDPRRSPQKVLAGHLGD